MKDFALEQKKELRDKIIAMQEESGLSGNEFAIKRLGFTNGSKFSHIRNNWDKSGMVGQETWEMIEKYIVKMSEYKGIPTANLKKVWRTCESAHALKKPMTIIGEGGLGKSFSLEKYKEYIESKRLFTVIYFDASKAKTNKQFIDGLMKSLDCYRPGTIPAQLEEMRNQCVKRDMLILVDEVSSVEGHNITIIKDVMNTFKDLCGIVFAGAPYFINNLNKGALRNRHLFSETRDRLFMLPEILERPTAEEAEAIFRINGINSKEELDILLGKQKEFRDHSWLAKPTFRGIRDCIDLLKIANMQSIDYSSLNL